MTISPDPEQRKKQIAAIQPAPNAAGPANKRALRHGAYCEEILSSIVERKEKEILDLIQEDAAFLSSIDLIAIRGLARCLARLERLDSWLEETGDITSKGKINTALSYYTRFLAEARRYCETLGLTPTSRARLGVDIAKQMDIARALTELGDK